MRREQKITVRKGEFEFVWSEQDWLGLIVSVVILVGAGFLLLGKPVEAMMVFSFGGGYGLHEIVSRAQRRGRRRR